MTIRPEDVIYETNLLLVKRAGLAHVSREDGGHIQILTKRDIAERRFMTPQEEVQCAWLTSLMGEAYEKAMNRQGVKVVKINYYDMANWPFFDAEPKPRFHIHIYGRVWGSEAQPFPEALTLPKKGDLYYEQTTRVTDDDVIIIREEIEALATTDKYAKKENWHF